MYLIHLIFNNNETRMFIKNNGAFVVAEKLFFVQHIVNVQGVVAFVYCNASHLLQIKILNQFLTQSHALTVVHDLKKYQTIFFYIYW